MSSKNKGVTQGSSPTVHQKFGSHVTRPHKPSDSETGVPPAVNVPKHKANTFTTADAPLAVLRGSAGREAEMYLHDVGASTPKSGSEVPTHKHGASQIHSEYKVPKSAEGDNGMSTIMPKA